MRKNSFHDLVLERGCVKLKIWDVQEPLRTTSTLAVTTLSASIERST